jgi:hypothetical protein
VELAASYRAVNTDSGGQGLWTFGLNLLALKWFPGDRVAVKLRLGAGYSVLLPDDGDIAESFPDLKSVNTNMGVSFLLFAFSHLYLEIGFDYANWFTGPPSGSFRPWAGLGLWF